MIRHLPLFLIAAGLSAQSTSIFPSEYSAVAEGPNSSPNLPLANGTSRTLIVYDQADVTVPSGRSITQLGFREDASTSTLDTGRALQLEVRMGYTTQSPNSLGTTFDTIYDGTPATVFGPALFQLPNLRDAASPLPNGQFFVTLATPFVYAPAGRNLVVEYRVFGNSIGGAAFNYRLDRADFYSPIVTGASGCQHSGNSITQLTTSAVRTGQYVYLNGNNGPANSFALVAVSVGTQLVTPYPLSAVFPGIQASCTGQLDLTSLATIGVGTSTSGSFSPYYSVPNNPVFNDLWLSHQALVLDVFSPGSVVTSNGVAVQVGIAPRSSILYASGLPSTTTTGTVSANYCPVAFFRWL
ncbi:MAG TPA: hypothetical protein VFD82_01785 [Planctomycetota bacterium]|nr:hypothetical protein [Planctomycetota bacterium]